MTAAAEFARRRVHLPYHPPLDWRALLAFLAPRAVPGVERIHRACYLRTVAAAPPARPRSADPPVGHQIAVGHDPGARRLVLSLPAALWPRREEIFRRCRRLFDLDTDPGPPAAALAVDPLLAPLVAARPGLRVPGCWDRFELLVRAVLGQQVTVRGATTLATRLVRRHGTAMGGIRELRLFPSPQVLAIHDLADLGMPRARGRTIQRLAAAMTKGDLDLAADGTLETIVGRLCALPGIGPWTAHYAAMRAFGQADAFPASDLALRRALADGGPAPSPRQTERRAEAWRPWRAYATMHLWSRAGAAGSKP